MNYIRSVLLLLVACSAGFLASPAHASSTKGASDYIQSLGDKALSIISHKQYSKDQKQDRLEKLFSDSVDFDWVAKFVMGRYWRKATDAQKKRYVGEYRKFLTLHYTSRFADYTSGTFKVTNAEETKAGEYRVSMELKSDEKSNDPPVYVDYRVRKGKSGFMIFDVIVEGVSLITTQRSEFASVLNDKGIDHLTDQLAAKSRSGEITSGDSKDNRK